MLPLTKDILLTSRQRVSSGFENIVAVPHKAGREYDMQQMSDFVLYIWKCNAVVVCTRVM
jgi:hypothetical protein